MNARRGCWLLFIGFISSDSAGGMSQSWFVPFVLRGFSLRSLRLSSPHLRWLACLLALLLLLGEQGALRHMLSHLPQALAAADSASHGSEPPSAPEHAACAECAAFAALNLDTILPMASLWVAGLALRWHFPSSVFCAHAPVFAVAVCARDPPFQL